MKDVLSGWIVVCAACMFWAASRSQTSNNPAEQPPMAMASAHYLIDHGDTAIEFSKKLTERASGGCVIADARAAIDFIPLGFAIGLADVPTGITPGRAKALVAVAVGLISLVVGGLALSRSAGRIGVGSRRAWAIAAVVLGLVGVVLSVVHLATSTGGFGTGGGRAGAIVALVLGLIGTNLGGLALARSRRTRSTT